MYEFQKWILFITFLKTFTDWEGFVLKNVVSDTSLVSNFAANVEGFIEIIK